MPSLAQDQIVSTMAFQRDGAVTVQMLQQTEYERVCCLIDFRY